MTAKRKTAAEQWRELPRGSQGLAVELLIEMAETWESVAKSPPNYESPQAARAQARVMRLAARVLREAAKGTR